jgi:hypothetical protein
MSSALAIAAVTACLKDLLNDGLLNHDLSNVGSFTVSATPPDRITTGANEPNQLNLFLYQVTANLGWRNVDLPSRDGKGARLTNPPLALDLHYLLTAYGSQDLNAEILLGYAMQLMHETPVLTRDQLRTVLSPPAPPVTGGILPGVFGSLSALDLADQVELIKIAPVFLSTEELSKMWTAMQARYRPTMAYVVSVVLIQETQSIKAAPPVLKRGKDDTGPKTVAGALPGVLSVRPLASDLLPSIRLGDDLLISGAGLATSGASNGILTNTQTGDTHNLALTASAAPPGMTVHVPSITDDENAMNQWSVGLYGVTLDIPQSPAPAWIALSPIITVDPLAGTAGDTVTITCTPRLLDAQNAQTHVIFGSQSVDITLIDNPVDLNQPTNITFDIPDVDPGTYTVRLRVDGIDSLPVTISAPPVTLDFDKNQQVTVS